ncbi:unnamed protein product, partial [marine sediment metagenome]
MKIYFNYELIYNPWGGVAHFLTNLTELLKEKGYKIALKWEKKIDLIFILSNTINLERKIFKYKKKSPDTKVLHRINITDICKNT